MWKTETKVGLFTIIALLLFGAITLFLNHTSLFSPPQITIVGHFKTVTGLKDGNSVRYSGVPVGKIKAISVSEHGVLVTMDIKKSVDIPKDSQFSIQTDGLLGEKFVGIAPGTSTVFLKNGDYIEGEGQNEMDATMNQMNRVLTQADKLLTSINKVAGDPQAQAAMKATLGNTSDITANLAQLTGQMNGLVSQNKANLNEIAQNMAAVSRNMNQITTQLNTSLQTIDKDGQSARNIREILQNLQESTASLAVMANTMQGVVTDQQTVEDIKTTLHNTAHITSVINTVTGGGSSPGVTGTGRMEMLYNTQKKSYSPNVDYSMTTNQSLLNLGVHHIGDGSGLELQYGKIYNSHWVMKGGLFEGKLGFGVDWGLPQDPFRVSIAALNPNDVGYRLRTEFRLTDSLRAVAQWARPFHAAYGGNYFGLQYGF